MKMLFPDQFHRRQNTLTDIKSSGLPPIGKNSSPALWTNSLKFAWVAMRIRCPLSSRRAPSAMNGWTSPEIIQKIKIKSRKTEDGRPKKNFSIGGFRTNLYCPLFEWRCSMGTQFLGALREVVANLEANIQAGKLAKHSPGLVAHPGLWHLFDHHLKTKKEKLK